MQEISPYNQVIFKNGDDKNNADLVNSYRFRSASPIKFKKWSPEISREERYKKKREREDEYVKTLDPEEKPILLIKNKNLYKNVKSPHLIEDPASQNDFYKISKNTEVIEDINEQIQLNEELIRKKTIVYKPKENLDEDEPATFKNIFKINGIEFLPEGFLELEPLLMRDEFEFDSKVHEGLFSDEQKKIKVQRRKQYAQKELQKKREVTIFVVDQYKDKLVEYLDQWYAANKRKMTPDELEYVSKILKTDPESMGRLQDLYLHRKKVLNSQKLHGHLYPEGKMKDERFDILPDNLKKLFSTRPGDAYADVEAKVYKVNEPYNPTYLKKHMNKNKRNHSQKPSSTQGTKSPQGTQNLNATKDQNYMQFTDNFENMLNGTHNPYQNTQSANQDFSNTTGRVKKSIKFDNDLKTYFDTEINTILDRIKGFSAKDKISAQAVPDKENQKFIDQYKEKLGDLIPNPSDLIRMDSQLEHYNQNPNEYKPYAKTDLLNNPDEYKIKGKPKKAKINMMAENKKESITPKKDTVLSKSGEIDKKNSVANKSFVSQDGKGLDDVTRLNDSIDPRRVTIVSRNDRGASIVSQKLKPSLIDNEYFFQVIDDVIEPNGSRKATILTRNEKGEIVAEQILDIHDIGNFYQSYVVVEPKENRVSIVVRNEKGDSISVTPVKTHSIAKDEEIDLVLQRNGIRRSTITTKHVDGEIRRSHKIRPTLVGTEYYNQLVEEIFEGNSKKKLTITTYNENGETVSVSRANPNLMAENYYTELISDLIDDNGQRKIVMSTINNRGESVIRQTFTTSMAGILAEQFYTEMLEEVEDDIGKRKVTIASKNARGYTEVTQQFRPTILGENYYIEIVNDTADKLGNRKVTLAAKDNKGDVIVEKQYEPDVSEIIGEKYYNDLTKELEKELSVLNQSRHVTQVRPENQDFSLELFEQITPNGDNQVVVTARNTNGAIILERTFSINEAATLGDEHYDAIINEIEDELANRTRNSVLRKNTGRSRNQTTKLSQINENEEKHSVSVTSFSRPSQTAEKIHEKLLESAIHEHEKQLLDKHAVSVSVPRVTRVRDSYYRDLLNELGYNKKNFNKNHRLTQQHNPFNDETERNKSYTINPRYVDPKSKTSVSDYRSPSKILEEVRSRNTTHDNRSKSPTLQTNEQEKSRQTEVEKPRPKNFTVKAPKRSTVGSKIEERPKNISEATALKKNTPSAKKIIPSKDSITSKNALPEQRQTTIVEAPSKKNSTQSVVLNQLNKKSLLDKLILDDRRSLGNTQNSGSNAINEHYEEAHEYNPQSEHRETVYHEPERHESVFNESKRHSTDAHESKRRSTDAHESKRHSTDVHEPNRNSTVAHESKRHSTDVHNPQRHDTEVRDSKRLSTDDRESKRHSSDAHEPEHHGSTVIYDHLLGKGRDTNYSNLLKPETAQKTTEFFEPEKGEELLEEIQPVDEHHNHRETSIHHEKEDIPAHHIHHENEPVVYHGEKDRTSEVEPVKRNTEAIVDEKLKNEIDKLLDQYKDHVSEDVLKKIEDDIVNRKQSNLLDEFYAFCESELPNDVKFKESMLLVSLFYYFLEKKQLIEQE